MGRIVATLAVVVALLFSAGSAWADYEGAAAYERGDYKTAFQKFSKEAEQGHADAQYLLYIMYKNGEGVPKNLKKAVKWLRKSADQNDPGSQAILSLQYAQGNGVPKSLVRSYMWASLADVNGYKHAGAILEGISEHMTRDQIAKAQELASEWWEKHGN